MHSVSFPILTLLLGALAAAGAIGVLLKYRGARQLPQQEDPFCETMITQTFIAALPSITKELNLEVATSWQIETLEKTNSKRLCGVHLGTNTANIRMPVTYRFHVRVRDPWDLGSKKGNVVVIAPVIRPTLPPSIHTDGMVMESSRGWCRVSPEEMLWQLHRDLTPTLCKYAEDPRRLHFVRETARMSVAEFVRMWLIAERRWGLRFTSIQVQFRDEKALPETPTLQLSDQ